MQSNASIATQTQNDEWAEVTVPLIQHWARMVEAQAEELATYRRQIRAIDARATRLYNENHTLHGLFNEAEAELHYHRQTNLRLSALLTRIEAENPGLDPIYAQLHVAMIEGTVENPIDLTTDEELDEEM